jgi:hypothetical protein
MNNFSKLAVLGVFAAASASYAFADAMSLGRSATGTPPEPLGFSVSEAAMNAVGDRHPQSMLRKRDDTAEVLFASIIVPFASAGADGRCADTRVSCITPTLVQFSNPATQSGVDADMFTFIVEHDRSRAGIDPTRFTATLVSAVAPEPASLLLLTTGLLGGAAAMFFRRRKPVAVTA